MTFLNATPGRRPCEAILRHEGEDAEAHFLRTPTGRSVYEAPVIAVGSLKTMVTHVCTVVSGALHNGA